MVLPPCLLTSVMRVVGIRSSAQEGLMLSKRVHISLSQQKMNDLHIFSRIWWVWWSSCCWNFPGCSVKVSEWISLDFQLPSHMEQHQFRLPQNSPRCLFHCFFFFFTLIFNPLESSGPKTELEKDFNWMPAHCCQKQCLLFVLEECEDRDLIAQAGNTAWPWCCKKAVKRGMIADFSLWGLTKEWVSLKCKHMLKLIWFS